MAQNFPALTEEGMISGAAAETTANFKSISSGQVIMMSGCRCDRIKNMSEQVAIDVLLM